MPKPELLSSGKFRIRWVDPWGKRTSKVFSTAADARAWYRKIQGDIARGTYTDPRRQRTTVAEWADDWLLGARHLSTGGRTTYRRDLDRYIIPKLGKIPLVALDATTIDRFLAGLTLAPSSAHRQYRTLHRMLRVAVDRGLLPRNPCDPVEPPRIPPVERPVLTVEQIDQLAEAITRRYRAWVYVMCYGGLRWSESIGLRRRHIAGPRPTHLPAAGGSAGTGGGSDPAAASATGQSLTITVAEQLIHRGKDQWERVEPKTRSRRTLTLPDFVAAELDTHLRIYAQPGPEGLVFPTRNGTPPQSSSFRTNTFGRALTKAGLPRLRIHDLRHTAVSLAIAAGADPKASQARAGHSSIGIHLDTYGHLYPAADAAVAAALDNLHATAARGRLRVIGD